MGLRISEAVKVNISDVDFQNKQIRVFAPKTGNIDFLPLHDKIYEILTAWVRKSSKEIDHFSGYLVYSDEHYSRKEIPLHLTTAYMRRIFREYMKAAGLANTYATIKTTGGQPGTSRNLYRLSTHSLRHNFITRVYQKTMNPSIVQKLARHSSYETTGNYINLTPEDTSKAMKKAFDEPNTFPAETQKVNIAEFLSYYEVWREHKK